MHFGRTRLGFQRSIARYSCYLTGGIFAICALFVLAYPERYALTVIGSWGLLPAANLVAYHLVYKVYQKNSLLQYFSVGFLLTVVGCLSCYAASVISGLPAENFVWAVVGLFYTGMWFLYGILVCGIVTVLRAHRHR